jgi:hypothetical protein
VRSRSPFHQDVKSMEPNRAGYRYKASLSSEILDVPLRRPSSTRSASAANTVAMRHVNVPV